MHPLSLLITALVLLPNLGFFLKKAEDRPKDGVKEPVLLVALERIGQLACFVLPLFYRIRLQGPADYLALIGMALMLGLYYYSWFRYFRAGNRMLYASLFKIPIPLAVMPVIYFALASVILNSLPMLLAVMCLAAGHIPITWRHYRESLK